MRRQRLPAVQASAPRQLAQPRTFRDSTGTGHGSGRCRSTVSFHRMRMTPRRALDQPSCRRQGLWPVDSQWRRASFPGRLSGSHPMVTQRCCHRLSNGSKGREVSVWYLPVLSSPLSRGRRLSHALQGAIWSAPKTATDFHIWGRVTGQCILRGLYQPCHPGVDDTISGAIARPVPWTRGINRLPRMPAEAGLSGTIQTDSPPIRKMSPRESRANLAMPYIGCSARI